MKNLQYQLILWFIFKKRKTLSPEQNRKRSSLTSLIWSRATRGTRVCHNSYLHISLWVATLKLIENVSKKQLFTGEMQRYQTLLTDLSSKPLYTAMAQRMLRLRFTWILLKFRFKGQQQFLKLFLQLGSHGCVWQRSTSFFSKCCATNLGTFHSLSATFWEVHPFWGRKNPDLGSGHRAEWRPTRFWDFFGRILSGMCRAEEHCGDDPWSQPDGSMQQRKFSKCQTPRRALPSNSWRRKMQKTSCLERACPAFLTWPTYFNGFDFMEALQFLGHKFDPLCWPQSGEPVIPLEPLLPWKRELTATASEIAGLKPEGQHLTSSNKMGKARSLTDQTET